MSRPINVFLFGPPGSGKGTVARHLLGAFNLANFETGAELRAYAAEQDPVLAARLAGGGMASDELVMAMLSNRLAGSPPGTDGWLIDGTPRSVVQADGIITATHRGDFPVSLVIALEIPDAVRESVLTARCLGRSTCGTCGTIYHDRTSPAPAPGRCTPACGGTLVVRADDSPAGIAKRYALFLEKSVPALARLEAAGLRVIRVDASQPPERVCEAVSAIVRPLYASPDVVPARAPDARRTTSRAH